MDIDEQALDGATNNETNLGITVEKVDEFDESSCVPLPTHVQPTKKGKQRRVSFPDDHSLVSKTVDPVNPWADVSNATSSEVVKAYVNSCARLRVKPIDKLVKQLREHDVFQGRINILDLKGIKLDARSCETLEEIFKRVQVHTLDIENTHLEDEGAIAIIEMIEFYQSAIHIIIGYNPRIKTRGWQIFSQMIRKATFVEFADLRHCCLNDPCMAMMARSLKLNTSLRVLHLEADNLSGKLLIMLCTGLKLNQTLSELFLGDNFLVPSDATTLSAMLKSNSAIQLLDIRNNMLQDQGVLNLCDGLHHQTRDGVKTLVLWNNQISKLGMVPLSNLLAATKNIQTLNVGHNRLGNDGIRNLQVGLLKNKSLLRLGLLNTKISAEGAVALAEYVADTRTLLRLDLRENDLYVGGLMALTLAVKINETVVRIDLDKDLKKEQGMERTQTSLLVDIYQYLERNKKFSIQKEELRQIEGRVQVFAEQEEPRTPVHVIVPGDKTERDKVGESEILNRGVDDDVNDTCSSENDMNGHVSCFAVYPVEDKDERVECNKDFETLGRHHERHGLIENCSDEANILAENLNETQPLPEETCNNIRVSDAEEFEKQLDELLVNVSGVKIDLSDFPEQDEEFWKKDMQEIIGTTAS